jgi:hypothetical protein
MSSSRTTPSTAKTESWRVTDFDAVHRDRVSIGAARP